MEKNIFPDGSVDAYHLATIEFDKIYVVFAKSCGLTEPEFWSLLMMYNGVVTQSEISDMLVLNRQTVNSAFKLLIKKDLVRLESPGNNLRTKVASFTENGKQFIARYIEPLCKMEQQAWESLDVHERKQLIHLTRKYCDMVQKAMDHISKKETTSSED